MPPRRQEAQKESGLRADAGWTLDVFCTKLVLVYETLSVVVIEPLAAELREFGKAGGFRKNAGLPVPQRLLRSRSVQLRAELEDVDGALRRLQAAIQNGFLSVQLLRFEERFGLAKVRNTMLYSPRIQTLEGKVDVLRRQYRPLVEALTAQNGGPDDAEE